MLEIGQVLRYDDQYSQHKPTVDGLPNYWYETRPQFSTQKKVVLSRGINPVASVGQGENQRTPAIVLRSSPHKVGSAITPWQDVFRPDFGYVLYHGDNKLTLRAAHEAQGNKRLIIEASRHWSPDQLVRMQATPLIFFRGVSYNGIPKGHLEFQGYGIVERIELITQYDEENDHYFPNYAFSCVVFNLAEDSERFDWNWVNARRDPSQGLKDTHALAPRSWRTWVASGGSSIERVRRRVARRSVVPSRAQSPPSSSAEERNLATIYNFYEGKKHNFEALAAEVTGAILSRGGNRYSSGWLTPASGEGGVDFVGLLELGSEFARIQIVVLGQAKCERPDTPTNGRDIARTVARLRRGWIGAYVTTSYFSEPVQQEVIEDSYPLLLVHGLRLVGEAELLARKNGTTLEDYLVALDETYKLRIQRRRPEEVLSELGGIPLALTDAGVQVIAQGTSEPGLAAGR